MIRRSLLVTAVVCLGLDPSAVVAATADPATVASGLAFPAGLAFDSDGTMYVTEREGRILSFDGDRRTTLASIPTITQGETGLLGIVVSPDDRYVYAFATETDQTNTVWRVPTSGGDPERVVRGLPGGTYHNGGGVAFGPDGFLYVSNGERHEGGLAQDPRVLGGKVYRYAADGSVPSDNPFGDSPAWAIGLRNPFGIAIDPLTGDPFVTENGPEAFDEVNRVVRGGNYGWPVVYGPAGSADTTQLDGYRDPILAYEDIIVPTGIAFADPATARSNFAGDLFFATFGDQTIHRVVMDDERTEVIRDDVWFRSGEPIVALAWGPRGLYYSTPGAVGVFDLAAPEEPDDDQLDDTDSTSPADAETDPPAPGERTDSDGLIAVLLFGGAAAVLVIALVYAFRRDKKGRT